MLCQDFFYFDKFAKLHTKRDAFQLPQIDCESPYVLSLLPILHTSPNVFISVHSTSRKTVPCSFAFLCETKHFFMFSAHFPPPSFSVSCQFKLLVSIGFFFHVTENDSLLHAWQVSVLGYPLLLCLWYLSPHRNLITIIRFFFYKLLGFWLYLEKT